MIRLGCTVTRLVSPFFVTLAFTRQTWKQNALFQQRGALTRSIFSDHRCSALKDLNPRRFRTVVKENGLVQRTPMPICRGDVFVAVKPPASA